MKTNSQALLIRSMLGLNLEVGEQRFFEGIDMFLKMFQVHLSEVGDPCPFVDHRKDPL